MVQRRCEGVSPVGDKMSMKFTRIVKDASWELKESIVATVSGDVKEEKEKSKCFEKKTK